MGFWAPCCPETQEVQQFTTQPCHWHHRPPPSLTVRRGPARAPTGKRDRVMTTRWKGARWPERSSRTHARARRPGSLFPRKGVAAIPTCLRVLAKRGCQYHQQQPSPCSNSGRRTQTPQCARTPAAAHPVPTHRGPPASAPPAGTRGPAYGLEDPAGAGPTGREGPLHRVRAGFRASVRAWHRPSVFVVKVPQAQAKQEEGQVCTGRCL